MTNRATKSFGETPDHQFSRPLAKHIFGKFFLKNDKLPDQFKKYPLYQTTREYLQKIFFKTRDHFQNIIPKGNILGKFFLKHQTIEEKYSKSKF